MPFLITSSWQNGKDQTVELAIRDHFKPHNTFWSSWYQDWQPSLLRAAFLLPGPRLPFYPPFHSILSDFPNTPLSYKPLQTMLYLQEKLHVAWRHGGAPNVIFVVVAVQLLSCVWLSMTPWAAARQASLSFTVSLSLLKHMSIESVMPSNHLILCHPLLLLPSIFPSNRVFSSELALCIKWAKYWSYTFSTSCSNEYSG